MALASPPVTAQATAVPRTPWSDPDREWLEAKGVRVQYRASLEQDFAAIDEFKPDLAIGTTPVVQKAKTMAIPALYFTNLISARPLFGAAGAGSLAQVINAALGNKARFDEMKEFFGDVGEGYAAGVWEDTPKDVPAYREKYRKQIEAAAKKRKAEESEAMGALGLYAGSVAPMAAARDSAMTLT